MTSIGEGFERAHRKESESDRETGAKEEKVDGQGAWGTTGQDRLQIRLAMLAAIVTSLSWKKLLNIDEEHEVRTGNLEVCNKLRM